MKSGAIYNYIALLAFLFATPLQAGEAISGPQSVRRILTASEKDLDFLSAAIAFDKIIDPALDEGRMRATIAALVQSAGNPQSDQERFAAVRRILYQPGAWNGGKAFAYDQADPLGQNIRNKMLSTYLRTRLGNCVSMPVLYLILADKLGMKVSLSTAPDHVFVKYIDPTGRAFNVETTSGGNFARDDWYKKNLPMTERAVESGLYLRTFSKRESIAEMANTVLDYLISERRYREAVEVADAILQVNTREGYTMVRKATALSEIVRTEYQEKYPTVSSMPAAMRASYRELLAENRKMFQEAESLGWAEEK